MASINEHRLYESMSFWHVPREWADVMYRYVVRGLHPGSFFTAMLANDALNMIQHSHPANTIAAMKNVAGWIRDACPRAARGSYDAVDQWCFLSDAERNEVLIRQGLFLSPEQVTMELLKRTKEPVPVEHWYHH